MVRHGRNGDFDRGRGHGSNLGVGLRGGGLFLQRLGGQALGGAAFLQPFMQAHGKGLAVGQQGQRIVHGLPARLLAHQTLHGHVLDHPDQGGIGRHHGAWLQAALQALQALAVQAHPDGAAVLADKALLAVELAVHVQVLAHALQQLDVRRVGGAQLAYRLPLQLARRIAEHARGLQAHQLQMRRPRDHQAHGSVVHQRLQLQLQPADLVRLLLPHLPQAVQGLPQRGGFAPGMGPGHAPAAFLGMARLGFGR